jgi:hypothetical protein
MGDVARALRCDRLKTVNPCAKNEARTPPLSQRQTSGHEPRFSGAHDPLAALILCGAHRADRVMIAGEWRVIDGAPVGLDLDRLIAEHRRAALDFA